MNRRLPIRSALLLSACLFAAGPVLGQQLRTENDTLRLGPVEAMAYALEISPEVEVAQTNVDFAVARKRFALANRFLTEFTATTAHSVAPGLNIPSDTIPRQALYLFPDVRNDWDDLQPFNRLEVEALQPIYTWGQLSGSIRAARYGVEVEEAAVAEKALEVAYRTGELYYSLLLADALFLLTRRAGEVVEQAKTEIQRLLDEGAEDVDDADLYQVLITEQEYNRRVAEVVQRRQTARVALARQLFLSPEVVVVPEDEVLEPIDFSLDSLETYFARALQYRPELAQARAGIAAREALVEVAQSDYFPKLFLGATARYAYAPGRFRQRNPYIGDPFLSRSVQVGLGLRQQLNFAQTHAEVEQAEAERNEVVYQLEAARQLVLFQVEEAYRSLLIARAALDAQQEALRLSEEWLLTETINFDLDLGDTENLVDAVRANLELEAGYFEAVQRYNVAVLRLLRATGILVDRAQSGTLVD